MSDIPGDLKFMASHEWVRVEEDGLLRIGISDHAQNLLGDLVYVELPESGDDILREDACAVVESVKAASDVYAPVSGEIVEVNESLADSPETVNESPYDDGWLFTVRASDDSELGQLLDAEAYQKSIADEDD
ncbi:MAG: glycine cleavage system protein GcvH [Pseudomonadota bacterium]